MPRFKALDAFRGFTIAAMILVNTPGSRVNVYAPLQHAAWHGWTPTDLVFPFFLFIVGSAMYFSLSAQNNKAGNAFVYSIFKRGLIMFAIGLGINALSLVVEPWSQLRIMGVLQRIAIVYVFAALIIRFLGPRWIIPIVVFLLLSYWALLMLTYGITIENNIVRYFDLAVLGPHHMWEMNNTAFDPQGLLSTFPAIVNTLVGFEITRFLVAQKDKLIAFKKMIPIAIILISTGWVWGVWLPINMPLWTSSYVIFTSGMAVLLLAVFIWVVDIQKMRWLEKPLVIYGQNPLFIYTLSMIWPEIFAYIIVVNDAAGRSVSGYEWLYVQLATVFSPINASLVFAVLHVVLFWLVAYVLYRKNILIKI